MHSLLLQGDLLLNRLHACMYVTSKPHAGSAAAQTLLIMHAVMHDYFLLNIVMHACTQGRWLRSPDLHFWKERRKQLRRVRRLYHQW